MDNCTHCDEAVSIPIFEVEDQKHERPFCCQGCLTVYHVLHEKNLNEYYDIKRNSAIFKRRAPIQHSSERYLYLDTEEFAQEYVLTLKDQEKTLEFYLEGIHCLACLWLIEKLQEFVPNVISSKLNLEKSVVTVIMTADGKFSEVARELNSLGYRPHPFKNDQKNEIQMMNERRTLKRLGIAGAAAGNIMIYAVSLYGGASGEFASLFNAITVLLAVPVLTFSAWPFYESAFHALKKNTLSIDVPISLALIMGGIMGLYNLVVGVNENYFDSLCTLVFLLLLSRYFLRKIQERGLRAEDLHFFYQTESVERVKPGSDELEEIHSRYIQEGDVLKVKARSFFPADGVVKSGVSKVDNSLLTGESLPMGVMTGDKVFSGTQNLESDVFILVEKAASQTRLGMILKNIENSWGHRSRTVDVTARISKYFTAAVFLFSILAFVVVSNQKGFEEGILRALTLLIVTCPCALALSVPLTFNRALSQAAEHGVIIKSDEVIEKLSHSKKVFLDKTGTLTFGRLVLERFQVIRTAKISPETIIISLEQYSQHPVARVLVEFAKSRPHEHLEVGDLMEKRGMGVSGTIQGQFYEIKKNGLYENGQMMALFEVRDMLRPDSRRCVEALREKGLELSILSGDSTAVVHQVAAQGGLLSSEVFGELSPDEKLARVKESSHSVMIGDGANDAMALEAADVGIAVWGAMDISLRVADVYLTTPGLSLVEKLFTLSTETMRVIRRNLLISVCYNFVSVIFVFTGHIDPLVAAIIMPVSSLTVFFSSLYGTRALRSLWKS